MSTELDSQTHSRSPDASPFHAQRCRWKGRPGIQLTNNSADLVILEGGGVIARFASTDSNSATPNALWESPWFAGTDTEASDGDLQRVYGDLGTGRFLHHFTGHALCLDGFGPATAAEVSAGSGLHGEASIVQWLLKQTNQETLEATAELPLAGLTVQRNFSLHPGEPVVRVREHIANHHKIPRPVHWVQHATVGPPLFGEHSIISSSVDQGITSPTEYEGCTGLAPNSSFTWPHATRATGTRADLRQLFSTPQSGFVAAARQPSTREYGFVAAYNPKLHISLLYVFPATAFPWVTFWEENRCRVDYPWSGTVQARGLEFGTTPLPLGNAVIDAAGPLLGAPTSRSIAAGEIVRAPWIMALVNTPIALQCIDDIVVEDDVLLLHGGTEQMCVRACGVRQFLNSERAVT